MRGSLKQRLLLVCEVIRPGSACTFHITPCLVAPFTFPAETNQFFFPFPTRKLSDLPCIQVQAQIAIRTGGCIDFTARAGMVCSPSIMTLDVSLVEKRMRVIRPVLTGAVINRRIINRIIAC